MGFTGVMEHVAQGFEAFGAAVLVVGLLWSLTLCAAGMARGCQHFRRVNAHAHLPAPRDAARIGMSRPPAFMRPQQ